MSLWMGSCVCELPGWLLKVDESFYFIGAYIICLCSLVGLYSTSPMLGSVFFFILFVSWRPHSDDDSTHHQATFYVMIRSHAWNAHSFVLVIGLITFKFSLHYAWKVARCDLIAGICWVKLWRMSHEASEWRIFFCFSCRPGLVVIV